jgi:dTDP-4-dehydrorhamnose 3,5-epimerase
VKFVPTELPEVVIVTPEVLSDSRGHLFETYHGRKFAEAAIDAIFVQDTQSRSAFGVIRGLHAQRLKPQAKLIRVLQGAIFDVAVDIRKGSPTFARWVAVELSAENRRMLFVPRNFAHGFCVTSTYAEVEYKSSNFYQPADELRIAWNDPAIGVKWPTNQPILSDDDARAGSLDQLIEQLPVFPSSPDT